MQKLITTLNLKSGLERYRYLLLTKIGGQKIAVNSEIILKYNDFTIEKTIPFTSFKPINFHEYVSKKIKITDEK